MNKTQRKELQAAIDQLVPFIEADALDGTPETKAKIEAALSNFESVTTDTAEAEREKFDNMPEGLQASETGQAIENVADTLEGLTYPDLADYDLKTADDQERLQFDLMTLVDEVEGLL